MIEPWPTQQPSPPSPPAVMRCLVAVMGLLLLSGCGASAAEDEQSLAQTDPNGYQACTILTRGLESTDVDTKLNSLLEAGEKAKLASSADIRESATELTAGMATADPDKLRAACLAHGITVPEATQAAP